jgi:chromosome segregation protein
VLRLHLSSISLRGFKSFPDPVEIRLEPGVAVVVGPNGSGKSNIADAIVWAAGSLSPSELRAEKTDDVLFVGSGARAAAEWCEVELRFDNAERELGGLDFSDVSIVRRLHRGGEGQYLVNGAVVRRTDLVELLADVGLGPGMHSVIGQGRVEAILASSPAERRVLVEEAAGLGRFKRRRHRAGLKLARVGREVERARDVEAEARKRLRPLALQATAAERAEKLGGEIAAVEARLAELDLAALDERLAAAEESKAAASLERKRSEARLEAVLLERQGTEEELADAAGRRESATAALYRLRSAEERVALRRESLAESIRRFRCELEDVRASERGDEEELRLEVQLAEAVAAAGGAALERDRLAEHVSAARERLCTLERSLAEREGLPPAARELSERGEVLAVSRLDPEPGLERAVAAALTWRASAVSARAAADGLAMLERTRERGLGTLVVIVPPPSAPARGDRPTPGATPLAERVRATAGGDHALALLEDTWLVEPAELLQARRGVVVTADGHGYAPEHGELWFAGETAEGVLLELQARRSELEGEVSELERRAAEASAAADRAAALADSARAAFRAAGPRRPRVPAPVLERLVAAAERAAAALERAGVAVSSLESPLRARADAGGVRTGELAAELRTLGGREAELRRALDEARERAGVVDVELARLEAEAQDARRRLDAAGAPPASGSDRGELEGTLERLRRRRDALGEVNPLAKEEHARERERLTELVAQREDLERSLAELERLIAELTETVDRRFAETFGRVREHFTEVAATLFPGGEGRLRLTEPQPEDDEAAEAGVEVELRPAGKRVTRLSLLSGGERALGAIAFLFSLFLARPCPFYLLDEVEAALDDPNIGRFVSLLRSYADRAQFVVVTHQKRTMEAADVLYGVTMGADGVSQVVSRRVPREDLAALA